ncbi:DoxX family protein [Ktedonospora formicarum]|uniref:LysR family transcriptional regulator n=1 Tax=Ktedonospora formicarum TaxID=2778364 RepID=A0A8J3I6Z8_9CHLR|nr:DoxX family protein [Ktedonospora formicarum]GHO46594.1 LysR family transcriptional regulator [Ktedonospora formicarum]
MLASTVRLAPLALRLLLGLIFIVHGTIKLLNLGMSTRVFAQLGIPLPAVATPAVASLEVIGGLALLAGFAVNIFTILLVIMMIVAIWTAKRNAGFVGGYEFDLLIIAALVSLFLSGPGKWTLWQPNLGRRNRGWKRRRSVGA